MAYCILTLLACSVRLILYFFSNASLLEGTRNLTEATFYSIGIISVLRYAIPDNTTASFSHFHIHHLAFHSWFTNTANASTLGNSVFWELPHCKSLLFSSYCIIQFCRGYSRRIVAVTIWGRMSSLAYSKMKDRKRKKTALFFKQTLSCRCHASTFSLFMLKVEVFIRGYHCVRW